MLTKRQKETVFTLMNKDAPIRIKDLADQFTVTSRTIKNDIKTIKSWLQSHHITLYAKPNKGVWLEFKNEREKLEIHHNLSMVPVDEDKWSMEGRLVRISLILILHPSDYITADMLAADLSISKKTVYTDMKKAEAFLEGHDIYLITTARKGYSITGREIDIRQFAEYLLTQGIADAAMNRGEVDKLRQYLTSLSSDIKSKVLAIDHVLETINKDTDIYQPTSIELLTLFVRLLISISRIDSGYRLHRYHESVNTDVLLSGFASFAHLAMDAFSNELNLAFSDEEFIYIYRSSLRESENDNIVELTNNIIHFVSSRLSIPFYNDSTLQANLLTHLMNNFTLDNALLLKRNPFMKDLKTDYRYLYEPVKEACERYMVQSRNATAEMISSFITLHFLVSLETTFSDNKPLKALYVCATGRGVARVVKNRVEKEVPQLRVVQYCGMDDVEDVLQKQTFDLVISVFPITIDLPTVWVEAVPTERNIKNVKALVKELSGNEMNSIVQHPIVQNLTHNDDAESVSREIILTAMEIYHSLREVFVNRIKPNLEDAFLMHIFLMVHRVKFSQEYDHLVNNTTTISSDFQLVDKVFKKHHFQAASDELEAVLFYIERKNGR